MAEEADDLSEMVMVDSQGSATTGTTYDRAELVRSIEVVRAFVGRATPNLVEASMRRAQDLEHDLNNQVMLNNLHKEKIAELQTKLANLRDVLMPSHKSILMDERDPHLFSPGNKCEVCQMLEETEMPK